MKHSLFISLLLGGLLCVPGRAQEEHFGTFNLEVAEDTATCSESDSWDWTLNAVPRVYFYKDGLVQDAQKNNEFRLPYFMKHGPCWEETLQPDIYPNDGWMLVSRNFGTTEKAPMMPHFMLYNKYRGILRIFVYNAQALQYSFYRASLSLGLNGDIKQLKVGIMTFADSDKCYLNDYNPETCLETLAEMPMDGWSKFDFIVAGYDPSLINKTFAGLAIQFDGIKEEAIKLQGNATGDIKQEMKAATPTASRDIKEDVGKAFNDGIKIYKDYKKGADELKNLASDPKNKSEWWIGPAKTLAASFLTGGTMPAIAGAVGFISSFIGGSSKQAPALPMNFKVKLGIELDGKLTSTTQVTSGPSLYLNRVDHPSQPVQDIPWGVLNIEDMPELMSYRLHTKACTYTDTPLTSTTKLRRYKFFPQFYHCSYGLTKLPKLILNPESGMSLESFKWAGAYENSAPSPFKSSIDSSGDFTNRPASIAFEIKLKINNPTGLLHQDPVQVFYKTAPFKMSNTYKDIGLFEEYTEEVVLPSLPGTEFPVPF